MRPLAIFVATAVIGIGGGAVGAGALGGRPTPPPVLMTRLQSRGAALKGYRTTFELTQAQVAALSGLPATKISRLERGLDSATAAQEDAIVKPLDSIFRARYERGTELWLAGIVARVRRRP